MFASIIYNEMHQVLSKILPEMFVHCSIIVSYYETELDLYPQVDTFGFFSKVNINMRFIFIFLLFHIDKHHA